MPTVLSFLNDRLNICSASVLGDYVDLSTASKRARQLLGEISRQGFVYPKDKWARLAAVDYHGAPSVTVPRNLNSEDEIESFFLNPAYAVGRLIVFQLNSGHLQADLRMTNMRRAFHNGSESMLREQEDSLTDGQRLAENVYYLEMTFSQYPL
jgi:hypothetical protein